MPKTLITAGTELYIFDETVEKFGELKVSSALPPAVIGGAVYYVPITSREEVWVGDRVVKIGKHISGIAAHHNLVYIVAEGELRTIDPLTGEAQEMPIPFKVTGVASTGLRMLVQTREGVGILNFETWGVEMLTSPTQNRACHLSPFGTVHMEGEVYHLAGGKLTPGGCDVISGQGMGVIVTPSGETFATGLGPHLMYSPIPEQDVPTECMVCMCELEDEPSVTLYCGHAFHRECILQCLKRSEEYCSTGDHITFQPAKCPGGCGKIVTHRVAPCAESIVARKRAVEELATRELREQGAGKSEEDLLYYVCGRCRKPFFGGLRHCPRMMGKEPPKSNSDLICNSCANDFECETHGRLDVIYKCRFCCNPACHLSFGCYYVCERCDKRWETSVPDPIPCDPSRCPLGGSHIAESYPLGCGVCGLGIDWSNVCQ